MWLSKEDLRQKLWDERQKALLEMKTDMAFVLNLPIEMSWLAMVDHVEQLELFFKKHTLDVINERSPKGFSGS